MTPRRPVSVSSSALRPAFAAALGGVALLAGALLLVAPAASALLGHGAWPALHARCVGVMALALAGALLLARRALDPAVLRLPLLLAATWAATGALALLRNGAALSVPVALAGIGFAAWRLARIDDDLPAPAQHADAALLAVSGVAATLALLLLALPDEAAPFWPWRLGPAWVTQYAPLFAAWGAVAAMAARERRRCVRAPVLWALLLWSGGTAAVSLWHAPALRWASAAPWLWLGGLVALAATAAQRLGLPRRLGRGSRDGRTRAPRQ